MNNTRKWYHPSSPVQYQTIQLYSWSVSVQDVQWGLSKSNSGTVVALLASGVADLGAISRRRSSFRRSSSSLRVPRRSRHSRRRPFIHINVPARGSAAGVHFNTLSNFHVSLFGLLSPWKQRNHSALAPPPSTATSRNVSQIKTHKVLPSDRLLVRKQQQTEKYKRLLYRLFGL
jgi:hypothetical protein